MRRKRLLLCPFAIQQRASPHLPGNETRLQPPRRNQICEHPIPADFPMPSHRSAYGETSSFFLNASFSIRWRGGIQPRTNPAKAVRGSEVRYGRHPTRRLSSTPSWERATHLSTTQQTPSSKPTTAILLVRMMFCGHNIEFSCPAALTRTVWN
jgi:hypothetical protein